MSRLLIASLILNGLLIGFLIGQATTQKNWQGKPMASARMKEVDKGLQLEKAEIRKKRKALMEALQKTPFETAAFELALSQLTKSQSVLHTRLTSRVREVALQSDPEGRKELSRFLHSHQNK